MIGSTTDDGSLEEVLADLFQIALSQFSLIEFSAGQVFI